MKKLKYILFMLAISASMNAQQLAFPGAEGFGRFATGGRGGSIYHVTNLNDSGTGSLRDAVSQPNRIVVFDVAGTIYLKSGLVFSGNSTILGQTAPGEGIQVYGDRVSFSGASNLIVRHMRFRMGVGGTSGKDAAGVANGRNMIFDHLSVLWGRDECFSISWDNKGSEPADITIQNSIIGQGLQSHSCGGLIQTAGGVTLYRNLYIENKTRNPKVKGLNQFVNNVVYNWGNGGCYLMGRESAGSSWADIENNYFIRGPWASSTKPLSEGNENFQFYADGNYYDNNTNGQLDGSAITDEEYTASGGLRRSSLDAMTDLPKPFPAITGMRTAEEALRWMIDSVGPSLPVRDEVDKYLIDELSSFGLLGSTGGISDEKTLPHGGTGTLYTGSKPKDSDGDGIPDEWETAHGLDPDNAADAVAIAANGYANIENYVFTIDGPYPYTKNPSEPEAPSACVNPSPAVNTKVGAADGGVTLSWENDSNNDSGVITYTVLLGRSADNLATIGSVKEKSMEYKAELEADADYYWRVDATNDIGTTTGKVWNFRVVKGSILFYTDFNTTPKAFHDKYPGTSNTNIINGNTSKTVAGMTFGANGSSSARIVSFSDAALTGDYTSEDAGATARCIEFTSGSGYVLLPEVEGPCDVTIWTGNSNTSSKTFLLKTVVDGTETTVATFKLAAAKKNFKHSFTYADAGRVAFKVDGNGQKFRVHDVLIQNQASTGDTGIHSMEAMGERCDYYTLEGRRVASPVRGLYIMRTTTASGKVSTRKIIH